MAVDTPIYQVVHSQRMFNQDVLNVYYYQVNSVFAGDSLTIVAKFIEEMLPAIRAIQGGDVVTTAVSAVDLFNEADFSQTLLNLPGLAVSAASDTLPSFVATTYTLAGENSLTRKGAKRIAGVPETAQSDGVLTDSSFLTSGNALRTKLAQDWTFALGQTAFPVIVKRIKYFLDGTARYRLPENAAEALADRVISATFNLLLGSQVSRKIGVGS